MKQLSELVTDEDIFEYVTSCLIKQGDKSILGGEDENYGCAYRGINNTKCAVGHLIDDLYYDNIIENLTIYDDRVQRRVKLSLPLWELNEDMLSKMQNVHDQYQVEQWEVQFSRFQFSSERKFEGVNETV